MSGHDLLKRALKFLKKFVAEVAIEEIIRYGIGLGQVYLKMRSVDTGEIAVTDIPIESYANSSDFHFVDRDFTNGLMSENSKSPEKGKYKIVSFYSGGGVGMRAISMIAMIKRWKKTNISEVLSVGKNCNPKELGLGDNFRMIAMGVVIKRTSVPCPALSSSSPVVSFDLRERDGKQIRETSIYLHDLDNSYPCGQHILFRVD